MAPALLQEMADVDDAHALRPQAADGREQLFRVGRREAARRLVHDEHPGLGQQRAGDLDHLLFGDGERPRRPVEVEPFMSELARGRRGRGCGRPAGRSSRPRGLGAEQDVLLRAQVRREVQLLVNHGNSLRRASWGFSGRKGLSGQLHRPAVRRGARR